MMTDQDFRPFDNSQPRRSGKQPKTVRQMFLVFGLTSALVASPVFPGTTDGLLDPAIAHAAPVIGTSAGVRGNVFVTTNGARRKAQVSESIKLQDAVTTKQDSALQILLLDRSTFTVGQNCELTIDRFVYDPDRSTGQVAARVAKGAFRFMSGNIGKANPTNASVSTPTATIGIRGTFFEGIVGEDAVALAQLAGVSTAGANPNSASIIILRGPGSDGNTFDTSGNIVISTAGGSQSVSTSNYAVFDFGNGQAPIGPFKVTEEMQRYLDFFLRSSPNGPGEEPLPVGEEDPEQFAGQDKFENPVPGNDDEFRDLIDGIQDSITNDFCTDVTFSPSGFYYYGGGTPRC